MRWGSFQVSKRVVVVRAKDDGTDISKGRTGFIEEDNSVRLNESLQ